jgi:hypothetical protein
VGLIIEFGLKRYKDFQTLQKIFKKFLPSIHFLMVFEARFFQETQYASQQETRY